ncbi:N-acetyltransferase [Bacillus sp. HMF5848]|nr:N-acetyltransferase [Bacillus sp. HMF5848]
MQCMRLEFFAKDGSKITIRPILEDDALDVICSAKAIVDAGSYIQKERLRTLDEEQAFIRYMHQQGNMYIGVQINDSGVKGIARVIRGELTMKRHTGVFRTWLSQDAQGKGVGKKILEYTLQWCREEKLEKLWLTVFSSNDKAYSLYKSYGFKEEGRQAKQVLINGRYEDEIFMAYFFQNLRDA